MCTLTLPMGIVERFNKYLRHCLWRKYGLEERGSALISWDKVCKPKDQGGLGVLNLHQHNICIILKHLHKFLNMHNLPWVDLIWSTYYSYRTITDRPMGSFWWRSIVKLLPSFKQQASSTSGDGKAIQLWHDLWRDNTLAEELPELYSFSIKQTVSVHEMSTAENPIEFFHTPLSSQAHMQFQTMIQTLQSITLQEVQDKW